MNFDHICPQCFTDSPPPQLHVYLLFICLITYWVQLVLPMFVGVGHPQEHSQPNRPHHQRKLILLRSHQLSIVLHLGWGEAHEPLSCPCCNVDLLDLVLVLCRSSQALWVCHEHSHLVVSIRQCFILVSLNFWLAQSFGSPLSMLVSESWGGVVCDTDVPSLAEHSTNIYLLQFGQWWISALAHHTLHKNFMMSFKNCNNL